jgi:hypothetical protein
LVLSVFHKVFFSASAEKSGEKVFVPLIGSFEEIENLKVIGCAKNTTAVNLWKTGAATSLKKKKTWKEIFFFSFDAKVFNV